MPTADKLEVGTPEPVHDAHIHAAIDSAITKALADLGLDDATARGDLADLRAGLASLRKLRFDLIQKCAGWFIQAALMLMGLGILVILSHHCLRPPQTQKSISIMLKGR